MPITDLLPGHGTCRNRLWLAAFFAVLLLPLMLIVNRGLSDALVVLVAVLFLIESKMANNWQWLSDPVVKIGLIAWVWMMLAVSPFAYDPRASYAVALPWIRFVIFYAAMRYWVLTRKESIQLVGGSLLVLLLLVVLDHATLGERP